MNFEDILRELTIVFKEQSNVISSQRNLIESLQQENSNYKLQLKNADLQYGEIQAKLNKLLKAVENAK